MFNETEWDAKVHQFPRANRREIERNQREANEDTENGIIGIGWWLLACGVFWAIALWGAIKLL